MEFVAGPAVLVALAVALAADIAAGGQFGQHFGQALCGLPFQAGGGFGAFLALFGTAAPARCWRFCCGGRGGRWWRRRRAVTGTGTGLAGLLARIDFGGIARDTPDDAVGEGAFDQGFMQLIGQFAGGEFGKGAREGGFAGDFAGALPAADAAQRFVDGQSLDHRRRGRQAQYRLGDESPRQGAAILRLAAASVARRPGHVSRQPDRVEHDDQLLQGGGDRVEFLTQPGKQRALDVAPSREYIITETSHATTLPQHQL
jgi:hypothetical protein